MTTTLRTAPPPPCNPATLHDTCRNCGRRLHVDRQRGRSRRICDHGHPTKSGPGMCPGCVSAAARRDAAMTIRPQGGKYRLAEPGRPHPFCIHDEGEPCGCHVDLYGHRPH